MDKFDRRPTKRQRQRKLGYFALAFIAVSLVAAALPTLGPRYPDTVAATIVVYGWLWLGLGLLMLAGLLLVALCNGGYIRIPSRYPIALQPVQGPGFTPLELAAFAELLLNFPELAAPLRRRWSRAEVTSRVNNGVGCVTRVGLDAIQSDEVVGEQVSAIASLWAVAGLMSPVACTFWFDDGLPDAIEFFTDNESSNHVDWAEATFDLLESRTANMGRKFPPFSDETTLSPSVHLM